MSRQDILRVVRRIPKGRVATYGEVARLAGMPGHARQVGYALAGLSDPPAGAIGPLSASVPWQRVINARGEISLPGEAGEVQRALLRAEGVKFDARGRVDLTRFGIMATKPAPRRAKKGSKSARSQRRKL